MSSARYAPLPNAHTDPAAQNEMEAAFLDSDDEDDERTTSQPTRNGYQSLAHEEPTEESSSATHASGATYDFENVAYDADWARPPPGSPPPNGGFQAQGNSNGVVPDFSAAASSARQVTGGWLR